MSDMAETVAQRLVQAHGNEALVVARQAIGKMKMADKSLAEHGRRVAREVGVPLKR